MKKTIPFLFLLLLSSFVSAAEDQKISEEQCLAATTEIIKISEEAMKIAEDKKNVKKLEQLIAGWKKRLDSGDNACDVYQDIAKSSTTL